MPRLLFHKRGDIVSFFMSGAYRDQGCDLSLDLRHFSSIDLL